MFSAANTIIGLVRSIDEKKVEIKKESQSCPPMIVSPQNDVIAVTGATGFLGSHIVNRLLQLGFTVRAAVRSPNNKEAIKHLVDLKEKYNGHLTFHHGDLLKKGSYDEAFEGVSAVIHTAAVVTNKYHVKDPILEIVDPSVKGSENVYSSVDKVKSVKRVIHTSSVASVQDYLHDSSYVFTEKDWNEWSTVGNEDYYGLAKTKAEKIAVAAGEKGHYDVVVMNPSVIFGPCLSKKHTKASPVFIRELIYGNVQVDASMTVVDVRDVAEIHIQSMIQPKASGRYILAGDYATHFFRFPSLAEKCRQLRSDIKFESKVHSGILYNLYWYFLPEFERMVIQANVRLDNSKVKRELGFTFRSIDETILDTINSMVNNGFIKTKIKSQK